MNIKSTFCLLLAFLVFELQISGIAVCAQEISQASPAVPIFITPLQGGVEVVTKNGARIVRKVRRVKYYRRSHTGSRSVRRYHVVRHTQHPPHAAVNRCRVGDKIITKPAAAATNITPSATGAIELPRNIVEPLIIRGMDNLKAGKRYVEIEERDGKIFIKESGEINPNGQFLEVIEEDGVWKIKGTDIVVDYTRTFDVSKVPPGVKAYLKPSTDYIAPDESYVQYKEGPVEPIPVQADTIPPLVNPGDYVELHQVAADGDFAAGSWETVDVPVTLKSEGPGGELVPVGTGTGGGGELVPIGTGTATGGGSTGVVETHEGTTGGPGIGYPGGPGVPVTSGIGTGEGPGRKFPIGAAKGPGLSGVPSTDTPVGGIVPPGAPMQAAADDHAPVPAQVAETPPAETPKALPPVLPAAEETTPPAGGLMPPGFPMSSNPDRPSGVVPPSSIGSVPPPGSGGPGRGFHLPGLPGVGGLLPAALGTAALGGMVALPLALSGGRGGGGNPGYYPYPGGGSPTVTGSSPGVTGVPQPTSSLPPATSSPTPYTPGGPATPPPCTTPPAPPCTPPTTPPCTPPTTPPCPPPPCNTPPPCSPPPCGPPTPPCPPPSCPPPYCPPPSCPPPPCVGGYNPGCLPGPVCGPVLPGCGPVLPPGCGPVLPGCGPVIPGCPPGGYGYGCDTGYGYGNGCDTGYGYGNGCDTGYGGGYGGNPCMGNASKFGQGQGDGCATSFKERWWSERGRDYCYNDPCAAQQASCANSMGGGMGSGLGSACPPAPCTPPPVCPPY